VLDELLVALDVGRVELGDLGEETFVVTHVVEVPAVGEHDSIEWVHRDEVEVVSAVLAEELEQLVEEMGSGDGSTPWLISGFQHGHRVAHGAQPRSSRKASKASPNHDGAPTHDRLLSARRAAPAPVAPAHARQRGSGPTRSEQLGSKQVNPTEQVLHRPSFDEEIDHRRHLLGFRPLACLAEDSKYAAGVSRMKVEMGQNDRAEPPFVDVAAARTATLRVKKVEQVVLGFLASSACRPASWAAPRTGSANRVPVFPDTALK
jgi:hypothetical protein